jgi:hypothetical protein
MALNAAVATVAGTTYAAIHWLGTLGLVRVYTVAHTVGSTGDGWSTTSSTTHRALGLTTGPNQALTDLDEAGWKIAAIAGTFWMLRLGLRAANRRIGAWRGVGVLLGLGPLVAAGVAHCTTDAVVDRSRRARTNLAISAWVSVLVVTAIALWTTRLASANVADTSRPGTHAAAVSLPFSVASSALQVIVAVGGIALATFLTVSYRRGHEDWRDRVASEAAGDAIATR